MWPNGRVGQSLYLSGTCLRNMIFIERILFCYLLNWKVILWLRSASWCFCEKYIKTSNIRATYSSAEQKSLIYFLLLAWCILRSTLWAESGFAWPCLDIEKAHPAVWSIDGFGKQHANMPHTAQLKWFMFTQGVRQGGPFKRGWKRLRHNDASFSLTSVLLPHFLPLLFSLSATERNTNSLSAQGQLDVCVFLESICILCSSWLIWATCKTPDEDINKQGAHLFPHCKRGDISQLLCSASHTLSFWRDHCNAPKQYFCSIFVFLTWWARVFFQVLRVPDAGL